ncbi:hypothetical protein FIBSPDRAFT_731811 [Athelia psychrophila]|uniref:SET domain-containing protein n=1 Tax=Athelia psychrophila TaxID=1759441 RepID=A0A166Q4B9_9AGAM|nr:hypothetical protein FIBSPDRAFT_731811 [Fibularhizoctonia sp. CBS 109695]
MVYHKINFSDFTGIVLAGRDITEIIPCCQKTLATALGNAYIISPAAGKGSGMFTSRDIPAAGVILVENPVIVCPAISSNGTQESFGLLFDGLHPDVRAKALSLHNSDPLRPYAEGIVRTNAFGLPLESLDSAGPTDGMTHRGIFLDLSRCNHRHERTSLILQNTCAPNCTHLWDQSTCSGSLIANRPLGKGEEITIDYINITDSRDIRRANLRDMYHFDCECSHCDLPNAVAIAESDAARATISQFGKSGGLPLPGTWAMDLSLPDGHLVDAYKMCILLHEQEHIIDAKYLERLEHLAICYAMLGEEDSFQTWANRVLQVMDIRSSENKAMWKRWVVDPKVNCELWNWRKLHGRFPK